MGLKKAVPLRTPMTGGLDTDATLCEVPDRLRRASSGCPDSVTSIGVRLIQDESIQRLLAYVSGLPSDDRLLVLYSGFEELTCAAAGTRLGLTPETASRRWQNLRARMRENGSLRALALEMA